ncbi:hypothetical protein GMA10_03370 [Kocuria koreensis]|uniref:Uncharacterized protein n=1 Tax=Rothia koreensis TaxID=592378 RepID=A0A7K1LH43_9MICC|nr:DUF6112 family protein [Rothia koreensis]MUN54262.1 hypothetical protein [Rothia koreensis]
MTICSDFEGLGGIGNSKIVIRPVLITVFDLAMLMTIVSTIISPSLSPVQPLYRQQKGRRGVSGSPSPE